jgi:hypothetical protein
MAATLPGRQLPKAHVIDRLVRLGWAQALVGVPAISKSDSMA